jgi:hypothetical protein
MVVEGEECPNSRDNHHVACADSSGGTGVSCQWMSFCAWWMSNSYEVPEAPVPGQHLLKLRFQSLPLLGLRNAALEPMYFIDLLNGHST